MSKKSWWSKSWSFGKSDIYFYKSMLSIAAAAAIAPLGFMIADWIQGRSLHWATLGSVKQLPYNEPLTGASGIVDGTLRLTIDHPSTTQRLAACAPTLWLSLAVCLAVWFLWRMLRELQQGRPFVDKAVNSMRGLALVITFYTVTAWAIAFMADVTIASTVRSDWSVRVVLGPEPFFLFVGALTLLLFAEVFARGRDLAGELAEVI